MASQQDWINLILNEVGAALDNPTRPELDIVTPNLPILFSMYADKGYYPRLQYLFVKRHAIQMLMGRLRLKINSSVGGVSIQYQQVFNNLGEIYKMCQDELVEVQKEARANRSPIAQQGGPLQAPDTPLGSVPGGVPAGEMFDPNAPAYRGDPLSNSNFPGGRYGV